MDEHLRKACGEVVKNEFPGFIQILEQNLEFNRWGFTKIFSGVGQYSPMVIYASDACRVMFAWQIPDIRDERATIDVCYGRLHAPNNSHIMTWKGHKCYCWHGDMRKILFFLDGLSPNEAASKTKQFMWPGIMQQFRMASVGKGWTQLEYMAKMHDAIWQHYEQRIFDLFDLRQPSLWEEYSQFVADYERLEPGFSLSGYPTPDKVC